ncbi:MAG TPA: hypothetical protein VNV43_03955 [Candidatus Acidoferrales bacterium]|jgi:hypothetical protein|nr:hypothetical protein [Candidatus Acidoferrales bacterium]
MDLPIGSKPAFFALDFMTLDETFEEIKACAGHMDTRYGNTVFDEWAVVSLVENKARVLAYIGPRNDEFLQNFVKDLGALRAELHAEKYSVGDFEFNRHGVGTGHEVFMVLGSGLYLICNNTRESMDSIAKNPRWLNAQISFAELSDRVRSNPLNFSGDNTKFLKKPLI